MSSNGETGKPGGGSSAGDANSEMEANAALSRLRAEIRRVYHDIKNPVAIISGNAQLLNEIVGGLDLPDDVKLPISDIEAASELLAARVDQLRSLGHDTRE